MAEAAKFRGPSSSGLIPPLSDPVQHAIWPSNECAIIPLSVTERGGEPWDITNQSAGALVRERS